MKKRPVSRASSRRAAAKTSPAPRPSFAPGKGKKGPGKPPSKAKPARRAAEAALRRPSSPQKHEKKRQQKPIKPFAEKTPFYKPKGILLWGFHAVRAAWLNPKRKILKFWATASALKEMEGALKEAERLGLSRPPVSQTERSALERMLPRGSVHQGVAVEVEPLREMTLDDLLGLDEGPEVVLVLDQVTDPHNVGAILRSAAALGAGAVIVTERNAPNATGVLAKSACGAWDYVPLVCVVNLARTIEALKNENFWCVGLAEEGERDLATCALRSGRIALILGAEGDGLRRLTRDHCDELARLPTSGPIASLNVSNAAAAALYETRRQRLEER